MLEKKIILNERIRDFISEYRKSAMQNNPKLTANYISEQIGRAKSWLSQVENGRLKSAKTQDLVNVFCLLKNRDMTVEHDRKKVEDFLDDQIMFIDVTQRHGLIDEHGNILDFSEMLSFEQARGHLRHAGKNIKLYFYKFLDYTIDDLQKKLKIETNHVLSNIVAWFNRAFNDSSELFSDEVSTRNLFFLMETSIKLYEGNCDYFGLNHLNIKESEIQELKTKLDTDYFLKPRTVIKSLNEYTDSEYNDVVKNFTTEDFMTWKNKQTYIGDDVFPMVINYLSSPSDDDYYEYYPDLNKATGLSEDKYLYIMKQLYVQFDILYKRYKSLLSDYESLEDENENLYSENTELKNKKH